MPAHWEIQVSSTSWDVEYVWPSFRLIFVSVTRAVSHIPAINYGMWIGYLVKLFRSSLFTGQPTGVDFARLQRVSVDISRMVLQSVNFNGRSLCFSGSACSYVGTCSLYKLGWHFHCSLLVLSCFVACFNNFYKVYCPLLLSIFTCCMLFFTSCWGAV